MSTAHLRVTTAQDVMEQHGLANADVIIVSATKAGLPLAAACALMEKESGGRNVYGHDAGGALSGFPLEVNRHNYEVFRWLVIDQGHTSNGVGPAQLTYPGFFTSMESQGLKPWNLADNMLYGFRLLAGYYKAGRSSWRNAGTRYNGAASYGVDLAAKVAAWESRLTPIGRNHA